METPFNRCVECNEVITQPICTECLGKRMKIIVGEIDVSLVEGIKGFAMGGGTKCIFCGKGMRICAHCFSKDIYEYLLERNPKVAEEFLMRFDFDLRRELV